MNKKVTLITLITILLIPFFILGACTTLKEDGSVSKGFLAEDVVLASEELVQFGPVALPTYAPFTVDEVYVDRFITGDFKLTSEGTLYENQENPEFWYYIFGYRSSEKSTGMRLIIPGRSMAPSDELYHHDYESIAFGDGREGKYKDNGSTQFFAWEEMGVFYELAFDMPNGTIMPIDEIIKVVESFKPYNKSKE